MSKEEILKKSFDDVEKFCNFIDKFKDPEFVKKYYKSYSFVHYDEMVYVNGWVKNNNKKSYPQLNQNKDDE